MKFPRTNRIDIVKFTNDDWYSNETIIFKDKLTKLVTVSFLKLSNGKYRVCVWGNDDFGFEKDFDKKKDAVKLFKIIAEMERVNHQNLKDFGFIRA